MKTQHMAVGHTILALIAFRVIWGFVGNPASRFSSFVRGPVSVICYLWHLGFGRHAHFIGHNPAGALSIVALLAAICLQVGTGLFSDDDIAAEGPLNDWVSAEVAKQLTSLHNWNFYVVLSLVGLHIVAILFYRFAFEEKLTSAMITGRKTITREDDEAQVAKGRHASALVLFIAIAAASYFLSFQ